jgi:hypothetical protein
MPYRVIHKPALDNCQADNVIITRYKCIIDGSEGVIGISQYRVIHVYGQSDLFIAMKTKDLF